MPYVTCRCCGKEMAPHQLFEDSTWCVDCVELALLDQEVEDSDRVMPEIFSA